MLFGQDRHDLWRSMCTVTRLLLVNFPTTCASQSFLGCNSLPSPLMQVESTSIGWSLGYMLNMSNMIPSDVKKITPMTDPLFAGLIFLFSALTIVTVVFIFIIIIRTCYWGCTPPATSHGLAVTIPGKSLNEKQGRSILVKPRSSLVFLSEALHHLDTSLSLQSPRT